MEDQPPFAVYTSIDGVAANNFVLLPARYVGLNKVRVILGTDVEWIELSKIASVLQDAKLGQSPEKTVSVIQGRDLTSSLLQVDELEKKAVPESLPKAVYSQAGDILVQRIGQKPRAFLVEEELAGVIVSDTVYIVRFHQDDRSFTRYMVEFLNSDAGQALLTAGIAGAVIPTLRLTGLRETKVPVPNQAVIELIKDLHEVEQTLIARVNKARNLRQQLFSIDNPEQFNEQLQNLSIQAGVLSKSIVNADDLNFQIRNYYPHVLAYAYRSLDAYQENSALYKEQLRVAENVLAFLGSIGLSLAAWTESLSDGDGQSLSVDILRKHWQGGISPGDWRDLASKAATLLRGHDQFAAIASFSNVWFKGRGMKQSQFGSLTQELVGLKNDFKHDRGPQTTYEYSDAVQNISKKLYQVLQEMAFFVQHPMRLVLDSDVHWRTKKTLANTLVYVGDHPGLRQEKITLGEPVSKDKLYFDVKDEALVPLYPLISAHFCDSCKVRETYMIDRWDGPGNRTVLKSFERGHIHDNDQIAKSVNGDIEHWLKEVFSITT